jgi:hypothetical protein
MGQRNERLSRSDFSSVAHWLIRQAAHRAPEALASRLEEEWLADSESRSAALSRLRFAVGCCWAGLVIGNDYPRRRVAAASAVAPASGFVTLADRNFGYFSLRSATLFLIAGLHAAVFFGLIATLSHTQAAVTPPPLIGLGEEGMTTVNVCVDGSGHYRATPWYASSTRSPVQCFEAQLEK